MAIGEEIQKRQRAYIEILRKEVAAAKKIIGDRRLRDKAIADINFTQMVYFDYEPKKDDVGVAFNKNQIKVVSNDPPKRNELRRSMKV
jgi:hypothetical protein